MAYAHLHVHSQYSLLDGAIPIKKLAPAAAELGQTAVALTDHCNLYNNGSHSNDGYNFNDCGISNYCNHSGYSDHCNLVAL